MNTPEKLRYFAFGALAAAATAALAAAFAARSGMLDFAADAPHAPLVGNLIAGAREASIASRSAGIGIPADLNDPERLRRGAGNYAAMCATCHLAPGIESSELGRGLYPSPSALAARDKPVDSNPQRQFWIVKHGIKGSGMAAWGAGGMSDQDIWDIVALLQRLPQLDAGQYQKLVAGSDGHVHTGVGHDADAHGEAPSRPRATSHQHSHTNHRH